MKRKSSATNFCEILKKRNPRKRYRWTLKITERREHSEKIPGINPRKKKKKSSKRKGPWSVREQGDPIVEVTEKNVDVDRIFSKKFRGDGHVKPTPGDTVEIRITEFGDFPKGTIEEIVKKSKDSTTDISLDVAQLLNVDTNLFTERGDGEIHRLSKEGLKAVRSSIVGLKRKNAALKRENHYLKDKYQS